MQGDVVQVWDTRVGKPLFELEHATSRGRDIQVLPDQKTLITVRENGSVETWVLPQSYE
jgi:hypothetical protein